MATEPAPVAPWQRDPAAAASIGPSESPARLSTTATLLKHNPGLLSDELLEQTFAAREPLLADLVERVRQNSGRDAVQHYLLIGPRGSGKTTLLRLLAIQVRRDGQLGREWLPVLFAEEEFSIYDFKDLFLTIFERMGTPPADAAALRLRTAALSTDDPDAALQTAVEAVEDAAASQERRLLLLVDNLDLILERATAGDDMATRRLRSALQHSPLYMLVGSSTAVFDELIDYRRPLYQFFAPIYLRPLEHGDIMELLRRRALVDGNALFLRPSRELHRKVQVITEITGGSPRLVVALYDVLSGRPILAIMDALTRLMDELTPFYKHRLEALAAQQAKLVDTLVRAGGAANPTEIATNLGLKPNAVATQLNRLRDSGWVRPRRGSDRRSTTYELADQIFRIWYRMRYQADARRRYAFLVEFYQLFFTALELDEVYQQHVTEFRELALSRPAAEFSAISERAGLGINLESRVQDLSARLTTLLEALPPSDDRDQKRWEQVALCFQAGQRGEARRLLETSFEDHRSSSDLPAQAFDETWLGFVNVSDGRLDAAVDDYAAAERAYRVLVEQEGRAELRNDLASALHNRGGALADLGRLDEALAAYEEAARIYGRLVEQEGRAELRNDLASVLNNRGGALARLGRLDEAESTLGQALQIATESDSPYQQDIRREFATVLIDRQVAGMQAATVGEVQKGIEVVSRTIEPLDGESRGAVWIRYLLAALRIPVRQTIFETMLETIGPHLGDKAETTEVIRVAHQIRSSGDRTRLEALDEDNRNAVEAVLKSLDTQN